MCFPIHPHKEQGEISKKKHRSSTGCMPWLLEFQQHMNIKHCRDIPTGSHEKREGPLSIHFLENWNTIACPQLLSPLQQETFCKPDSPALVATAGLGPTNIALNMAWDYANTIKTISKSVFLLRVSWKNTGLMSWEFMGKRDIVQDHMQDIARFLTFLRKAVKPRQRAKTL